MIRYRELEDGFELFYKNRLVIKHSSGNPFLRTGTGVGTYRSGGGIFKIRDSSRSLKAFVPGRAVESTDSTVTIRSASGERVLFRDENGMLVMTFEGFKDGTNRVLLKVHAEKRERIHGCGEQYDHIDLRGRKVPLWVEEQGVGRGFDLLTFLANVTHGGAGGNWHTTYYSQPSYVSGANYFVHSSSTSYAIFDFRPKNESVLEFWQVPDKVYVGVETDPVATLSKLSSLTGRQPELPDWAYDGVWLGVQGGNDAVAEKYDDAIQAGVPVASLWAQDWEGRRVTSFGKQLMWNWRFDAQSYPDLPEVIRKYREKGVRYLGYINPFLALGKELYEEASSKGYLVLDAQGKESYATVTTFPAAMVDLTNPAAFEWIKGVIRANMIDIGLSGWMADFAEWMPVDAKPFSGENPELTHNKYAALWARANYEAVSAAGKLGELVFFNRSGYTGSGKYATAIWAGDQTVDFSMTDGLATAVTAGISIGYSGIGITHSDIGGYTSVGWIKRSKEVFMRWAEYAAFTPIMRTHESNRPDSNWQFNSDSETLAHFARMAKVHVALKPYIKDAVAKYAATGLPPMRHLGLHFPIDRVASAQKYEYLFGDDLLVAPVVKKGRTSWKVYVPEGKWRRLWDGEPVRNGWVACPVPFGKPPVFFRSGSKWTELFQSLRSIS